jgi:ATP-dependent Clp protease ATP-binding subunit ClpB
MRLDKFTQKAQEAIFEAQSLAEAHNHAQIEPEHLLLALLQQADGVAPQVIQGLGRNPGQLAAQVEAELNRRPKVYGAILQALQAIRGSQRVTSQNPETTYQALQNTAAT